MESDHRLRKKGFLINGVICLSPREAYELLKSDVILVDVRKAYETNYRQFDVPDVIYLEEPRFEDDYSILPKQKKLIIADSVGIRSRKLSAFLLDDSAVLDSDSAGNDDWRGRPALFAERLRFFTYYGGAGWLRILAGRHLRQ